MLDDRANEEQHAIITEMGLLQKNSVIVSNTCFVHSPSCSGKTFVSQYLDYSCTNLRLNLISFIWTGSWCLLT